MSTPSPFILRFLAQRSERLASLAKQAADLSKQCETERLQWDFHEPRCVDVSKFYMEHEEIAGNMSKSFLEKQNITDRLLSSIR